MIDSEVVAFNEWVMRVRPCAMDHPRLLVLIHGWTGDENSMWVFTGGFPATSWIMAPRAPHSSGQGGYSWRPADPETFGRPSVETLKPAALRLMQLIDQYSSSIGLNADAVDLVGFSQGAALVNLLGMLYPQRVRKMGVLAGFVPSGYEEFLEQRPLAGKKIFVAHGTQDKLVPLERARASIEILEIAGAQVSYCVDQVGHKVSANCLRALEKYLAD
ncbi:MAG: hypothetical protein FJZ87_03425 [Chloroflexi bacterium]|nr:hypothetical protein [Chloroflexota bacterium]